MEYLDSLNDRQLDAVRTTEGPVRVLAGAGTGKTRALTARYCYLTDLLGIDPAAILCLTFTNKAAAEMKQRIRSMLGDIDTAYICTFHSFCVRMLKEDIHVLNYPSNFVVADEDDQVDLLLKVYDDMGLTLKDMPVKRAIDYIGKRKGGSDDYLMHIERLTNNELLERAVENADRMDEIFLRYLYEQKKNYAVDFDDIIIFAHYILRHNRAILEKWQERMQYVMVDEFQDVSPRQYSLARLLAGGHRNLFIVGDPDQTIYSWRGADVTLFLNFDKEYPDARTVVLDVNYRSTPQIIEASNALIAHNVTRYPKELHAVSDDGLKPLFYHARSEKDEARWVAKRIKALIGEGIAPSDIALLYRAHHLSRPVEDALLASEIPYRIYSGTAFYARREVKDVTAYLRMLTVADDMAFRRTVNVPSRKIGKKKMALISADADAHGDSMIDALRRLADTPPFKATGAMDYLAMIDRIAPTVGKLQLGDIMQSVLDASGYEQMLRNLGEWERLDNLAELKRAIEEAGRDDDASLDDFLARVALISNMDTRRGDEESVISLMTVHTAKGMEFPVVFVCGLCEGSMPSRRSANPDDIEEERRLAYVALTRARKHLFMSDSEGFGHDNNAKATSRFVYEMGTHRLRFERPVAPAPAPVPTMAQNAGAPRFAPGDAVEHPVFGRGSVVSTDYAAQTYTIKFESLSTVRTMRFGAPLDPAK
ncbi:MAG: UvrD-helicase domain-containing protein [Bacteroidales bacterium]|nr:UvrD-helicase domain-containing protein [Bacteroidales bacterium]